jgi:hypothetical protein
MKLELNLGTLPTKATVCIGLKRVNLTSSCLLNSARSSKQKTDGKFVFVYYIYGLFNDFIGSPDQGCTNPGRQVEFCTVGPNSVSVGPRCVADLLPVWSPEL